MSTLTVVAVVGDFRRFQGSMRPRLWNWMRGERDGVAVSLFDYHEGHSQRDTPDTHTFAWIENPELTLPSFSLLPIPGHYVVPIARLTQAAAGLVVGSRHSDAEIAMPTHAEFENQYLLRGQDEAALRRVFTDRVLRFFQDNPGWMVEGDGKRLLLNRLSPEEVKTYWRGAVPARASRELAAAVSALRDGTLGERLTAPAGVRPADLRPFLTAALDVGTLFRTA